MRSLIFLLFLAALSGASFLGYVPWPLPAILFAIFLTTKVRAHNLKQLRQRKIEQTLACCREYEIRAEQVEEWFEQPHFKAKENFMDVHPGREAKAIAEHYHKL